MSSDGGEHLSAPVTITEAIPAMLTVLGKIRKSQWMRRMARFPVACTPYGPIRPWANAKR
jgi:hypothetical protein